MDPYGSVVSSRMEMRVVLTVPDFDEAVAFYRDALGFEQIADWSGEDGRVILLEAGRATIELFDERQAESVDRIEAGRRVSGPVRLAFEVADLDRRRSGSSRPALSRWPALSSRRGAAGTRASGRPTGCS